MRLVWILLLLVWGTRATTVSTTYRPGYQVVSTTGSITLPSNTPLVFLTGSGSTTIAGIDSSTAVRGQMLTVVRTAFVSSVVVNDKGGGTNSDLIVLPNGATSITVSARAGFKFVYYSPYWYLVGLTR